MSKPSKELNIEVADSLIKELLTPSEWRMVKQRVSILKFVSQGLSIRAIAEKVGVGTDTVVRTSKMFSKKTVKEYFRGSSDINQKTSYVFGKSED